MNTHVAVNKHGIINTPNQPMYKRFSVLVIHAQKGSVQRLAAVIIHLRGLPRAFGRAALLEFGLAPGGVCRADPVTGAAGALLPHRFTLASCPAVCSLWHFPAGRY
jgi:hypothetical protein